MGAPLYGETGYADGHAAGVEVVAGGFYGFFGLGGYSGIIPQGVSGAAVAVYLYPVLLL